MTLLKLFWRFRRSSRIETHQENVLPDEPIILHQYDKVAYDLHETAEVVCRIQAYPKPEFKWYYGSNSAPLQTSSEGHYVISNAMDDNDVYTSILRISNIKKQDYGEYNCQVVNNLGSIEARIKLQSKGPPEKPTRVSAVHVGHNFVTLNWEPGFNGGITNTKYFVSYKKVPANENLLVEGCGTVTKSADWSEVDCQQNVPCNVSHLEQHQSYIFKVKALNTKGHSSNSQEIGVSTRVDRLPIPHRVEFDPASNLIRINIPATCLPLIAVVETNNIETMPIPSWQVVDRLTLHTSGLDPTFREANLGEMNSRGYKAAGRSLADEPIGVDDEFHTKVRVKFCLRTQQEYCGEYVDAERK